MSVRAVRAARAANRYVLNRKLMAFNAVNRTTANIKKKTFERLE